MKVAICGAGPLGIEIALKLIDLGASVKIISNKFEGGSLQDFTKYNSTYFVKRKWSELTSSWGRDYLVSLGENSFNDSSFLSSTPTAEEYQQKYLLKLINSDKIKNIAKKAEIVRIHKRFLDPQEEIVGRDRFLDLFRIVRVEDRKEMVTKQKEESPELFEKMDEEVIRSLELPLESYEDFDVVIDAMGNANRPNPAGPSQAEAVNEGLIKKMGKNIFYGKECFSQLDKIISGSKKITIAGSSFESAMMLMNLDNWLASNEERTLRVLSTEQDMFSKLISTSQFENLKSILGKWEKEWEACKATYETKVREWRDLEDHIKAKISQPAPPERKLSFHPGVNIVAIDSLIDKEELFLTCEKASFRGLEADQKEVHEEEGISTFGCDSLLVLNGNKRNWNLFKGAHLDISNDLNSCGQEFGKHKEKGLYSLESDSFDFQNSFEKINMIVDDLLTCFSKVP
jgi:hypothetical protein